MRNNPVHYSKSGGKRQDSLERQPLRGFETDYSTSPRTIQGEIIPSMQTADAKAFKFKCTPKKAKSKTSRELEVSLKKHFGRAPKSVQGTDGQMTDMNYMLFFPSVKGELKNTVRMKVQRLPSMHRE